MKIVVDMNLSPLWIQVFEQQGWNATHWSSVGKPDATDAEIMRWARNNGYVVFTHDLDFGIVLALTHAEGPSVVQARTEDVMPSTLGETVVQVIQRYQTELNRGALITIDKRRARIRILPIRREP